MDDLRRLIAIEDIRQLKARYWQGVDLKDATLLRSVFADDAAIFLRAESYTRDIPPPDGPTPDAFVHHCLNGLAGFVTAHHGHNPRIDFRSDDDADGVWPMEDNLWAKDAQATGYAHMQGYGLYHDSYRRTADGWKISVTTLQRLHVARR